MQTTATTAKIEDFGQKIGGAKKDLAGLTSASISLITDDALAMQPLSKSFPRPDFTKMFRDNLINEEQSIKLQYLYGQIEAKPRTAYRIRNWVSRTKGLIAIIKNGLDDEQLLNGEDRFSRSDFSCFREEMQAAGWPQEDYNPYPYKISRFYSGGMGVTKGDFIQKRGTLQECVEWIKENTGTKKPAARLQYSIYRVNVSKTFIITPKGKSRIVLKEFADREDAFSFKKNNPEDLERIYRELRTIPAERNNWNRPRIGTDHRAGKDILPEIFSTAFPFRGVEFGNWVNQLERAACLNEAYDALSDLAGVLGVKTDAICLDGRLALAFGARGSGNASAHYEKEKTVINLTKTKGAGSLAHEWFHALDNYLCIKYGQPLLFATENPRIITDAGMSQAINRLIHAIRQSEFYSRSVKIDEYKSKKYWATMVELAARAFEKYVIVKLAGHEQENDYLANIVVYGDYTRQDVYPYPTDGEMEALIPFYDELLSAVFGSKAVIRRAA